MLFLCETVLQETQNFNSKLTQKHFHAYSSLGTRHVSQAEFLTIFKLNLLKNCSEEKVILDVHIDHNLIDTVSERKFNQAFVGSRDVIKLQMSEAWRVSEKLDDSQKRWFQLVHGLVKTISYINEVEMREMITSTKQSGIELNHFFQNEALEIRTNVD